MEFTSQSLYTIDINHFLVYHDIKFIDKPQVVGKWNYGYIIKTGEESPYMKFNQLTHQV